MYNNGTGRRLYRDSNGDFVTEFSNTPTSATPRSGTCYEATLTGDKFSCPLCGSKEGGTLRIISHYLIDGKDCPNKYKEYCQKERGFKGGRRKTKKARRNRRRYSRRN
jgi:hypothetical protein